MKTRLKVHGRIEDGILIKEGKKVVKFFKYDGYGIAVSDLVGGVSGVVVDSQYDGKLYTSVDNLLDNGIRHTFENNGKEERQIILPVQYWRGAR